MGHNGCDGSQASGPWAIGSGYRFTMQRRESCPQFWIRRYISLTADCEGTELLVSVSKPCKPILASTVNSLLTRFLQSACLHDFSAHSTCGVAATALIILGVGPHIVCELGDWRSFDMFGRFYNPLLAMSNRALALVPAEQQRDDLLFIQ